MDQNETSRSATGTTLTDEAVMASEKLAEKLTESIQALAATMAEANTEAIEIMTQFDELCDLVKIQKAINLLDKPTQKIIISYWAPTSRSKRAFKSLESSEWALSLHVLGQWFGYPTLVSSSFITDLSKLAQAAAPTKSWADVWNALKKAQKQRGTVNPAFQRGLIHLNTRLWVPSDINNAATALGFAVVSTSRKRTLDHATSAGNVTPPNSMSNHEPRGRHQGQSGAESEGAQVNETLDQHAEDYRHNDSSRCKRQRRSYSRDDFSIPEAELPRRASEYEEEHDGEERYEDESDADADATWSTDSELDGLVEAKGGFDLTLAQLEHDDMQQALQENYPVNKDSYEDGISASSSLGQLDETNPGSSTLPLESRKALDTAANKGAPADSYVNHEPRVVRDTHTIVVPSSPPLAETSAETLHDLECTKERLQGTRDGGWLSHVDFNTVLRLTLPPDCTYMEVPDYNESFNWAKWSRTSRKRSVADCVTVFCVVYDCTRRHWIMLAIHMTTHCVDQYDSLTDRADDRMEIPARHIAISLGAKWEEEGWKYTRAFTPQQQDTHSCGVFAMACILLLATRRPIPSHLNPTLWRVVLSALVGAPLEAPRRVAEDNAGPRTASTIIRQRLNLSVDLRSWVSQITIVLAVFSTIKGSLQSTIYKLSTNAAHNLLDKLKTILPIAQELCEAEAGACECDKSIVADARPLALNHRRYIAQLHEYQRKVDALHLRETELKFAMERIELTTAAYREANNEEERRLQEVEADLNVSSTLLASFTTRELKS
ncbi:hypothetical protein NX059_012217 [Plenodomus lindquistii]|nr:hypothetical protein NX059_012217 [Plenodomus lindquistii]